MKFNKNPVIFTDRGIEHPSQEEVKNTPGLFNASLEDAVRYGGDLTREALSALILKGDRKHIFVDTKISMLMPGMYPAIPGWHTDGVPRPKDKSKPSIWAQLAPYAKSPHYHLLVTGEGCLTDFITVPVQLNIPHDIGSDLYSKIDRDINSALERKDVVLENNIKTIPTCTMVEWDWWNLHRAVAAKLHEWRFLIRVTESDTRAPKSDLRQVIRRQEQVYVPESFGW